MLIAMGLNNTDMRLQVKIILMVCLLSGLSLELIAQRVAKRVSGKVLEKSNTGENLPITGVNVYWLGTTIGTITDGAGEFSLKRIAESDNLVFSFIGYKNDTVNTRHNHYLEVQLSTSVSINQVEVTHRRNATEISRFETIKTHKIGEKELLKAACCNLSESFETNPSVDVSFTDAITGTRQIQMLGLSGPYTQLTQENMPGVRGLSTIYGLSYIPGTWIESIQLNKGTGSVLNGFESVAGQINTELRKPETAERMYLNLFVNQGGRLEANANFAHKFKKERWSTAMLLHSRNNSFEWDHNSDGFMDQPLGTYLIGLNRWKYIGDDGIRMQMGIKATYIDNTGGQLGFETESDARDNNKWGFEMNTRRIEGWAKIGKVYKETPWRTIGLQLSGVNHEQESIYGQRPYNAGQGAFYANFIYQGVISNTNHIFRTGASFQYDSYNEQLEQENYNRTESVPGVYFEYSYSYHDKLSFVAGIRGDYHSTYGAFASPRLHFRYALKENTIFRASAGRGQRTANIIAENIGLLASSRQFVVQNPEQGKPYGLNAEVAWNYGLNLTQHFTLDYRRGTFSLDYYHTDFKNQIVVDLEQSPRTVNFYNLLGRSYSNSIQAQLDYELIKRFDVRMAYRMYDVQTSYDGKLKKKPLLASNRAFVNLAYHTRDDWMFDYTINYQGKKRLPNTSDNPVPYRLADYSPGYFVMNTQVSKNWNKKFEVYLGVENLLNFKQANPILANEDPFGEFFDSSIIWGPVFGRKVYAGLRYRIK